MPAFGAEKFARGAELLGESDHESDMRFEILLRPAHDLVVAAARRVHHQHVFHRFPSLLVRVDPWPTDFFADASTIERWPRPNPTVARS
jgi:hypothetical protein